MTRIVLFPHNHTTASNTILQYLARSPFGTRYPDAVALESDPDRLMRQLRPYRAAGGFAWPFGPIPLGDRSETWCVDDRVEDARGSTAGVPADPYATQMLAALAQTHTLLRELIGSDDGAAMFAGALLAYQGKVPLYCIDATLPEMALALLTLGPADRQIFATETLDDLQNVEACARRGDPFEQAMWKAHLERFGYCSDDPALRPAPASGDTPTPLFYKALLHWRDALMARRLALIAKYHRPDDIILAIVGAAHAFGVQERLQSLGMSAEIFWPLDA